MPENKTDAQKFGYEMLKIIDMNVHVKNYLSAEQQKSVFIFDFFYIFLTNNWTYVYCLIIAPNQDYLHRPFHAT